MITDEERILEIESEIAEITTALYQIRKGGQEYNIDSDSSKRGVAMADYKTLVSHRNDLNRELEELESGGGGFIVGVGW